MTEREQRIYDMTLTASFVRMYFDEHDLRGAWPGPGHRSTMFEDAQTVAEEAVEEFRRLNPEPAREGE